MALQNTPTRFKYTVHIIFCNAITLAYLRREVGAQQKQATP